MRYIIARAQLPAGLPWASLVGGALVAHLVYVELHVIGFVVDFHQIGCVFPGELRATFDFSTEDGHQLVHGDEAIVAATGPKAGRG